MRILLVYHKFYPMLGGVESYLLNIAQTLLKGEHKVDFFCSDEGEDLRKKEKFRGINIYRYEMPKIKKKSIGEWPLRHQEVAGKFIKENLGEYDLILVRSPIYVIPLIENYKKEKIVFIAPSFYQEFFKKINFKKESQKIARDILIQMEAQVYKQKIKIVALSNLIKKQIYKEFKRKITVIPPGIDIKKYSYSLPKHPNILFVGRLSQEKNVISLINSFSKVRKGNLLIVGGGELEKELKETVKKKNFERIKFFGWNKNPRKFYQNSSVFVLPSKSESFGHVLLEAMASGLPCIAFKPDGKKIVTASNEIIRQRKTGFLVKSEEEMTEKIKLLLSNGKLLKKMSEHARKEAEKYSWDNCVMKILKFANVNSKKDKI
jgi:glycosyltransferase involved in cell wall biosynthesis